MPKSKRVPELGDIQETLLIPLYGRAVETRKRNGLIHDPKAVEMVDSPSPTTSPASTERGA